MTRDPTSILVFSLQFILAIHRHFSVSNSIFLATYPHLHTPLFMQSILAVLAFQIISIVIFPVFESSFPVFTVL